MKKLGEFWRVSVRDFWKTGKAGFALFLISLFVSIYGYIAVDYEITKGWNGHESVQKCPKGYFGIYPGWWGFSRNDGRRYRRGYVTVRLVSRQTRKADSGPPKQRALLRARLWVLLQALLRARQRARQRFIEKSWNGIAGEGKQLRAARHSQNLPPACHKTVLNSAIVRMMAFFCRSDLRIATVL